jgi:hypothetical protein
MSPYEIQNQYDIIQCAIKRDATLDVGSTEVM